MACYITCISVLSAPEKQIPCSKSHWDWETWCANRKSESGCIDESYIVRQPGYCGTRGLAWSRLWCSQGVIFHRQRRSKKIDRSIFEQKLLDSTSFSVFFAVFDVSILNLENLMIFQRLMWTGGAKQGGPIAPFSIWIVRIGCAIWSDIGCL